MAITHLLVDYGEVLSGPHTPAARAELSRLTGLPADELDGRYWEHRPAYDRGQASAAYWTTVLQRPVVEGDPLLATLIEVDVDGWLTLNEETLAVLRGAERRHLRLALLSNAPHPLADRLDRCDWAGLFTWRFYSARLGVMKPEPRAFREALGRIGAPPEQTLFIDDRPANTQAAAELGLRTMTFTSAAALGELIGNLLGDGDVGAPAAGPGATRA
jgi:putative hydrolase of the HAD superfamily